jgi:predicted ATP-grasp superfamily ATP-dependent carboligase
MEPKPYVLVTDGQERSALAITRGLGRAGIPVIVGAETERSLAGASRYCVARWQYPSPLQQPTEFIASLLEAARRFNMIAIIPPTDSSLQAVAAQRDQFRPSITSMIPSLESYDMVSDKYRLMKLAQELGVPIPNTIFIPDGNIAAMRNQVKTYPVVVKPGRSLVKIDDRWVKTSVHFVSHAEELTDLYRRTSYLQYPSLIQQRIEGEGQGVFGLFSHGKPCALFAHRRIREKPPAGGVSVFRESIELPKSMTDYAVRLLEQVKWHGVAMVEFKVDRQSNVPMLMEINGRFWGSLQLAIDAGLNFPYLLYQAMNGVPIAVPNNAYRIGTKSRWLIGDLDHLLLRLTKSNVDLRLDAHAVSRGRCVVDFFKLFQPDLHYEVESLTDPGPAFMEYRSWLSHLAGSRS